MPQSTAHNGALLEHHTAGLLHGPGVRGALSQKTPNPPRMCLYTALQTRTLGNEKVYSVQPLRLYEHDLSPGQNQPLRTGASDNAKASVYQSVKSSTKEKLPTTVSRGFCLDEDLSTPRGDDLRSNLYSVWPL